MIPDSLKICGHTLRVVQKPIWDLNGTTGEVEVNNHAITISQELPESMKESVLLHEIIEFMNDGFELDLEHRTIECLEETLYQVLKDNRLGFCS